MASKPEVVKYRNPISIDSEWKHGVPDPYILRYNGKYYLYCSGDYEVTGIKAWSSENLITWKYEGVVCDEDITVTSWGAEVVYWNGWFYLYAVKGGSPVYVLKSNSPVGPFIVASEDLGFSNDESVFIDDDGKWYFTNASGMGIMGYEMKDPTTVGDGTQLNAYLNNWTEGPYILKRNDIYYLTYTGNHWLSNGYRVAYATAKDSPIGEYTPAENNPLLISTKPGFSGLGHSATVLGPDMDSYYLSYHNLSHVADDGTVVRKFNIDRLAFNGTRMSLLGPTSFESSAPKRPDFYTWIRDEGTGSRWRKTSGVMGNMLVGKVKTEEEYTAEFNFSLTNENVNKDASIGGVFSYKDKGNYHCAIVDKETLALNVYLVKDNKPYKLQRAELPSDLDLSRLHVIRVENKRSECKIFFDNMLKMHLESGAGAGNIGYSYRNVAPLFEYTAFSNDAGGSSDFNAIKPVPGKIEALHYIKGKNTGYYFADADADAAAADRFKDTAHIKEREGGFWSVALHTRGEWLSYCINVEESGYFGIDLVLDDSNPKTDIQFIVDDKEPTILSIPKQNFKNSNGWVRVRTGMIYLEKGEHNFKMQLASGKLEFSQIELYKADPGNISIENSLTQGIADEWESMGINSWISDEKGLRALKGDDARLFLGDEFWLDYAVELDLVFDNEESLFGGGIVIRSMNESYFEEQVHESLMGYGIYLDSASVTFSKLNYGIQEGITHKMRFTPGDTYHIKVSARGGKFLVFVNDMERPVLEYNDQNAYMHGRVGLWSDKAAICFKNLKIYSPPEGKANK